MREPGRHRSCPYDDNENYFKNEHRDFPRSIGPAHWAVRTQREVGCVAGASRGAGEGGGNRALRSGTRTTREAAGPPNEDSGAP